MTHKQKTDRETGPLRFQSNTLSPTRSHLLIPSKQTLNLELDIHLYEPQEPFLFKPPLFLHYKIMNTLRPCPYSPRSYLSDFCSCLRIGALHHHFCPHTLVHAALVRSLGPPCFFFGGLWDYSPCGLAEPYEGKVISDYSYSS